MGLLQDLNAKVSEIVNSNWKEREGRQVPEPEALALSNDAMTIEAAVLYADLVGSTAIVEKYKPYFPAEIYKCFLYCSAKIIGEEGGSITAYDGDRIMGVFIGPNKESFAARCALKINHAVTKIISPSLRNKYSNLGNDFSVAHTVGIDTSSLFVARTGVRKYNDLVWVGRAANYAAKLSSLRVGGKSLITQQTFDALIDWAKFSNGKLMWERIVWPGQNKYVYRSNWWWPC